MRHVENVGWEPGQQHCILPKWMTAVSTNKRNCHGSHVTSQDCSELTATVLMYEGLVKCICANPLAILKRHLYIHHWMKSIWTVKPSCTPLPYHAAEEGDPLLSLDTSLSDTAAVLWINSHNFKVITLDIERQSSLQPVTWLTQHLFSMLCGKFRKQYRLNELLSAQISWSQFPSKWDNNKRIHNSNWTLNLHTTHAGGRLSEDRRELKFYLCFYCAFLSVSFLMFVHIQMWGCFY